jgi:hypothetical protein
MDVDDEGAKAPYLPAEIVDYGDVSDLTEANPSSAADSGGSYS